ncbi:protein EARLY RESPONSIVE TO DEHYDRATION 15-like [Malania oleifera]|uniref:protein EARLY RESPONSIVE TO DEHYDRATION 15-like n=1 Tax=Malania oleifera TaxID=397392 RepID=UPI0025AEB7C9|nr:protein EARLY RESPONSIVE TO DEHYDRATION 15-like [Malania oleifera]XP_057976784.1 protein EARLY RESPONSIVE TO DEHYDRATION 15-like [Malania oleifera]
MALVSGGSSTLNPNAPVFIPAAFRVVEDFSPEWWEMMQTSMWFRDYWMSQHQEQETFDGNADDDDIVNLLPDTFDLGVDEEFPNLEVQLEELILSSEAKEETESALIVQNKESKYHYGMEMDAATMMMNLNSSTTPKALSLKSPIGPARYPEKPAKYMSPNHASRRIQQPR